jgi:hypothetical protein
MPERTRLASLLICSPQTLYEGACVWVRLNWAGSLHTVLPHQARKWRLARGHQVR